MTRSLLIRSALPFTALITASPVIPRNPSLHERINQPLRDEADTTFAVAEVYLYCDGSLVLPSEDFGVYPDYVAKAEEAAAAFRATEVADYIPPGSSVDCTT